MLQLWVPPPVSNQLNLSQCPHQLQGTHPTAFIPPLTSATRTFHIHNSSEAYIGFPCLNWTEPENAIQGPCHVLYVGPKDHASI